MCHLTSMCYRMNTINWPKFTCNIPVTNHRFMFVISHTFIFNHLSHIYVPVRSHMLCFCHKSYIMVLSYAIHLSCLCLSKVIHLYLDQISYIFSEDAHYLFLLICHLEFQYTLIWKHCFQMRIWKHPFVEYFTWDLTSLPGNPYSLYS